MTNKTYRFTISRIATHIKPSTVTKMNKTVRFGYRDEQDGTFGNMYDSRPEAIAFAAAYEVWAALPEFVSSLNSGMKRRTAKEKLNAAWHKLLAAPAFVTVNETEDRNGNTFKVFTLATPRSVTEGGREAYCEMHIDLKAPDGSQMFLVQYGEGQPVYVTMWPIAAEPKSADEDLMDEIAANVAAKAAIAIEA